MASRIVGFMGFLCFPILVWGSAWQPIIIIIILMAYMYYMVEYDLHVAWHKKGLLKSLPRYLGTAIYTDLYLIIGLL